MEGFQWLSTLWDKGFGGILADEMGLGKSVQLLSLIEARKGNGPSLIVCPASLVYNWAAECEKFAGDLTVEVIAGTKAQRRKAIATVAAQSQENDGATTNGTTTYDGTDVVITSYDLLRRDVDDYAACHFALMALDEAQYIKNHATKVAKSVKQVTADHRFALTGTPIENRLSELWSIFDFLMPGLLGTYTKFREKYEQPIMAPGPEHSVMADKLQALVGLFIKRRLKKDVLTDLPDKFENVLTVKLEGEQRKLYAAHEQRLRATLTKASDADFNTKKIRILAEFTLLREICCDPRLVYADAKNASAKLDAIVELVATCMDEGKKVLVFSQFTSFLELIGTRLAEQGVEYYTITGETPKKRRVELVDEFNGNDVPVFLISLKAGNTGLNLVGASVVVRRRPMVERRRTEPGNRPRAPYRPNPGRERIPDRGQRHHRGTHPETAGKRKTSWRANSPTAPHPAASARSARTICSACCHNMPAVAACADCVPNRKTKTERRLRISHGGRIYGQASFREGENPYWR